MSIPGAVQWYIRYKQLGYTYISIILFRYTSIHKSFAYIFEPFFFYLHRFVNHVALRKMLMKKTQKKFNKIARANPEFIIFKFYTCLYTVLYTRVYVWFNRRPALAYTHNIHIQVYLYVFVIPLPRMYNIIIFHVLSNKIDVFYVFYFAI